MNIFTKIHKRLRLFLDIDVSQDDLDGREVLREALARDRENLLKIYPIHSQFDYMGVAHRVMEFRQHDPFTDMIKREFICHYVNRERDICRTFFSAEDLIALYEDKNESKKDEDKMN